MMMILIMMIIEMKVMMTNAAAQSHIMHKGMGGEGQVMRVVGIGNAKSNDIMEEVKMEMLVVVMMLMGLVVIEMKVMLRTKGKDR